MSQGAITLADITSASWSLALDTESGGLGSGIGNVVQALDDINQCIDIIMTTIPGEDPFRPTFGCNIFSYIDKPTPFVQASIAGIVTNAIETWEPRIKVLTVAASIGGPSNPGRVSVTVVWQLNLPSSQQTKIGYLQPQSTTVILSAPTNLLANFYIPIIGTDDTGNPITDDIGDPATI
jgi:phage baseplate assembly protein W